VGIKHEKNPSVWTYGGLPRINSPLDGEECDTWQDEGGSDEQMKWVGQMCIVYPFTHPPIHAFIL